MNEKYQLPETQQEQMPTASAALEALDAIDDYARMNTGVDAIGPREVLRAFIQSHNGHAEPSPAEVNDFDATPAFYIDELTANTIKHTALINGKVRFSNKPTAECTIPVYWSALNQRLAVKEGTVVAYGNMDATTRPDQRILFLASEKAEADQYHKSCYDLTPLYTHPVSDDQQAKDAALVTVLRKAYSVLEDKRGSQSGFWCEELMEEIDAALSATKQEEV